MFNPKITYACGHTAELSDSAFAALCNIYNDEKRQDFLNEIQAGACPACYNAKLKKQAAEMWQLAPLTVGTPKQIAYAESVRAKVLGDKNLDEVLKKYFPRSTDTISPAAHRCAEVFIKHLVKTDSAKLWLDTFAKASFREPEFFVNCYKKMKKTAPFKKEDMGDDEYREKLNEYVTALSDEELVAAMGL